MFVFELTRDYEAILPVMLATAVADLVASSLLEHNLMTEKLARQGVTVPRGYEPDVLRHTPVRDAMTTPVDTLDVDATVGEARARIAAGTHHAYPLVDSDRRCVGIVTRGDLLATDTLMTSPLGRGPTGMS